MDPVRPIQIVELESLKKSLLSIIPGGKLTDAQCATMYKYDIPFYPRISVVMGAIDDCISELKVL